MSTRGFVGFVVDGTENITRIAAERTEDLSEFERDLAEQAVPSPAVQAWPLGMVL